MVREDFDEGIKILLFALGAVPVSEERNPAWYQWSIIG